MKTWKWAAALAALTAVSILVYGYYAPFFAPEHRKEAAPDVPTPCDSVPMHGNLFRHSRFECLARLAEAEEMKKTPGVVLRQGDTLHVFYRQKHAFDLVTTEPELARLTSCSAYVFVGTVALFDPASGRPEKIPRILCYFAETDRDIVMLPSGEQLLIQQASASPDGRILASGNQTSYRPEDKRLRLVEWPSRRLLAQFDQNCHILRWHDNSHADALCSDFVPARLPWAWNGERGLLFNANLSRDAAGIWHLQATRWLNPRSGHISVFGVDEGYLPLWALRPLPGYTATSDAKNRR